MTTNNNMKTIPLRLTSVNSDTILVVTRVSEMFRIERLYADRKIKTVDTYVNTKEDVIKIIDMYIEIQDSMFQYKQELAYDVGFDNDVLGGQTNKNICKERVKDLVELVGKLYKKDEKDSIRKNKKDKEKQERRIKDYYNLYANNSNSYYDVEKESFLIDYFTDRCNESQWKLCNTYDINEYNRYKVEENSLNDLVARRTRRHIRKDISDKEDDKEDHERRQSDKHMESYRYLTEKNRSSLVDFIEEEHLREESFLINYFTQRSKERDRKQSYSDDIENEKKEEMALFDLLETRRRRERT
jgi:hypothetical protein